MTWLLENHPPDNMPGWGGPCSGWLSSLSPTLCGCRSGRFCRQLGALPSSALAVAVLAALWGRNKGASKRSPAR